MKKRLRKKKHCGEFTEWGRQLVITQNRNTIKFLGIWEHLNNPGFKPLEFDGIKKKAGLNSFILTAKRCLSVKAYIKGKDCLSLIKLPSSR